MLCYQQVPQADETPLRQGVIVVGNVHGTTLVLTFHFSVL